MNVNIYIIGYESNIPSGIMCGLYLDRVEIDKDVFKLFEQEKTGGHTLSARNCVWKYNRPS